MQDPRIPNEVKVNMTDQVEGVLTPSIDEQFSQSNAVGFGMAFGKKAARDGGNLYDGGSSWNRETNRAKNRAARKQRRINKKRKK